jgi:universal stress protein E
MKIVVTSDLSAGSSRAMERAFHLARQLQGELRILHVVDTALPSRLSDHARAFAQETLEQQAGPLAERTGIVPTIEVVGGDPRLELAARARDWGAHMLVAGVHRRRTFELFNFAGSTAGTVFAALRRPMLIVRNEVSGDYAQAVVGVDFSVFSRPAIRWARKLAPAGTLTLVHAYQVPFKPYMGGEEYAAEFAYAERLEFDSFIAEEMEWLTERARAAGIPVEAIVKQVREGAPAQVLRETVTETGADLAVVGTHGRTGLMKAILGSVAADLVKDPPTDLLIVPARD